MWERQSTQQEAEKRQAAAAAAAETERKRTAGEQAKEEQARRDRLRPLELRRSGYESEIFEANRVVRRLAADLKRLQDQDDEDLKKERERNSWWTFMTSPIYGGQPNETKEQRQERDTERLQRLASKTIKGAELAQRETRMQSLKDALQYVNSQIAAEKKKAEDEARERAAKRQHQFWKEQEARRRAEEDLEKNRRETQAKEEAARRAKAHEAWLAQERVRKAAAAAAEERRKTVEAEERAARMAEAARYTQSSSSSHYRASTSGSARTRNNNRTQQCVHDQFWPQIDGRHLCSKCERVQRHFAFQCPTCGTVACASCRQTLRGEKRTRTGANRAQNHHYPGRGRFDRNSTNTANDRTDFFEYDDYDPF
jgi:hypothetical protein